MPRRARGDGLIPDFLWPIVGWVIGALVLVVALLGALTRGTSGAWSVERPVMDWLRGADLPDALVHFGLAIGSPAFFAALVTLLAIWAVARRNWPALIALATVPGTVLIVEAVLKPVVDRHYVWGGSALYYPSGTAAGVAAWTTLTWIFAVPFVRRPGLRLALALALGALATLTAVSVVAAAKHYPLDAIGGAATGMAVVLACAALIDRATRVHDLSGASAPVDPETVPEVSPG
jgi:membrane-associated phospholipid phosphatase